VSLSLYTNNCKGGILSLKNVNKKGKILFPNIEAWETKTEEKNFDFGSNYENVHLINEKKYDDFWLQIEMNNGTWWEVPARAIADHRANFCNAKELGVYTQIISETLSDEEVLIDWAEENMMWHEISDLARPIHKSKDGTDFDDGWKNGMKQLIDHGEGK
jgi:hypothetical protein